MFINMFKVLNLIQTMVYIMITVLDYRKTNVVLELLFQFVIWGLVL